MADNVKDATKIKMMSVDDLIPYENNPRINDEAVYNLAQSIKEFGFKVPIVVDKDNVIVTGHTRLKAAKSLGIHEVPVIVADDLTPDQVKAFRLADNMTAQLSGWDIDLLNEELEDLSDKYDMGEFGFTELETPPEDNLADELAEKDDTPPAEPEYKVVINCKDEDEQKVILSKIKSLGYNCQPVSI